MIQMAGSSRRITLDQRSVFAGIRGVPGWAAVLLIVAFVLLSYALSWNQPLLGRPFTILYFAGCVLAVLLVQRQGLFWAAVVPPLIAAAMIPLFYLLTIDPVGDSLSRTEILTVLVPLAKRFPLILVTWLIVVAIALVRGFVLEPRTTRSHAKAGRAARARLGLGSGSARRVEGQRAEGRRGEGRRGEGRRVEGRRGGAGRHAAPAKHAAAKRRGAHETEAIRETPRRRASSDRPSAAELSRQSAAERRNPPIKRVSAPPRPRPRPADAADSTGIDAARGSAPGARSSDAPAGRNSAVSGGSAVDGISNLGGHIPAGEETTPRADNDAYPRHSSRGRRRHRRD